ncbi:cysteine-rich receptor-like protein kinase 8 [Tanacetum coccineum]
MPQLTQTNPSSSTSPDTLDDINSSHHPLYFHPQDHPGMILISKKLTCSENYSTWKRPMMIALSARNKLKLVNDQISNNLNFVHTAHSLWHQLHDHYSQVDGHRIYQLTNEIVHLKQLNYSVKVEYEHVVLALTRHREIATTVRKSA